MVEKNSNMRAALFVVAKKIDKSKGDRLKFISGYDDKATARALIAELDAEEAQRKHGLTFSIMSGADFFAVRPEMKPE